MIKDQNTQTPTQYVYNAIREGKTLADILKELEDRPPVGKYIFDFIIERDISVEVAAGLTDLNKTSLYKIINGDKDKGTKNPERNTLLRISRALCMDYEQTQHLLKLGNVPTLSGSDKRDVIIMDAIEKDKDIFETNQILEENNYKGLSK